MQAQPPFLATAILIYRPLLVQIQPAIRQTLILDRLWQCRRPAAIARASREHAQHTHVHACCSMKTKQYKTKQKIQQGRCITSKLTLKLKSLKNHTWAWFSPSHISMCVCVCVWSLFSKWGRQQGCVSRSDVIDSCHAKHTRMRDNSWECVDISLEFWSCSWREYEREGKSLNPSFKYLNLCMATYSFQFHLYNQWLHHCKDCKNLQVYKETIYV